ncbi:PAAR domain-containing protein [Citrobacter amalonaticus]|uniref:PAAR domain-containing protein n=1 Tax=Citrobacter amalonaticus TaxID=35703 RepID=A0A2S4RQL5_CITAM|nr:PAAR domain-containing protein [Citrobacter amalonaticus]POT57520.1 PAAR domain-containing protein [Citrobacter amalonaticus]POT76953.1 PAAR domain-containing protein [Citrobacter amalonaticus]POU60216.1 PAAR domain-containing protein [Citrobacter amalonaticus]POV06188.1 PAAR domain-containing protein [Citrobacter amalonaticus]
MRGIIRLGDKTTCGGTVLTASEKRIIMGKGIARVGDSVSCPKHGNSKIVEGDSSITEQGIPVAFNGHRTNCGCTLISSLSNVGVK